MKTTIALHDTVRRLWSGDRKQPLIWLLYPFSVIFRLGVGLRTVLYDRGLLMPRRLPCPIVSVGNITVGGTGKTPLVALIARLLHEEGRRPVVLLRGYGGRSRQPMTLVSDGRQTLARYDEVGDEAVLLANTLPGVPVLAGADRVYTGGYACRNFPVDVLVLDDGFQHRRLHRDLDIVLVERDRPFGNGLLLPAGPLREPPSALRRAGLIVVTSDPNGSKDPAGEGPRWQDGWRLPMAEGTPLLHACHRPRELVAAAGGERHTLAELQGKRICAFCGIGRPESFRATLTALGAEVPVFLTFPDHYRYEEAEVEQIARAAREAAVDRIVTTEKDAVRLGRFPTFRRELLLLRTELAVFPSVESLAMLLQECLSRGTERTRNAERAGDR